MRFIYSLLLFFCVIVSCKQEQEKVTSLETNNNNKTIASETSQMIDSIKQVKRMTNFRNHPYESYEKLKLVEAEYNTAKANNTLTSQLYVEYGQTLLEAGRSQDAINVFEDILNRMPENKKITPTTKGLHDALAISYMRVGEQINCRDNHSIESCLFPIKGSGIHKNKEGSKKAIKQYEAILKVFPTDLRSKWLLNVAYMTLGEYPDNVPPAYLIPPKLFESEYSIPVFENISMNMGLDVNDLAGGVIVDDFNNDGFIDIIASSWGMSGQIHYFKNEGNGNFTDKTADAGLQGLIGGLNLIQADYNNDGFLDIFVQRGAWSGFKWMGQMPNSLLKNNGDGTFTDVTISSGLFAKHPTQSAVWLDFNADGWLDLYVANETHTKEELNPCQFYVNQKDGTFKDIAPQLGLDFTEYIKGVTAGDINNDNLPDIYISILNRPNKLMVNRGGTAIEDWKFEDIAAKTNTMEPVESFPTWFFDYNNDGLDDIFVSSFDIYSLKQPAWEVAADYLDEKINADFPRLYKNTGNETFTNTTQASNLNHVLPAMGCNYGDIDNDGYLDMYFGTGAPDYRAIIPNKMFRNAKGEKFQDVTSAGNFGHLQKGHGIGFADMDNDGDQDIYAVMGGSVSGDIFQNAFFENPGNNNQFVIIRLKGTTSNRSAIGARIKVTIENNNGTTQDIYNTVSSGGSFGANSLQAEIGLGNCKGIKNIAIDWPDGKPGYIDYGSAKTGTILSIEEGKTNINVLNLNTFTFNKMNHSGSHDMM